MIIDRADHEVRTRTTATSEVGSTDNGFGCRPPTTVLPGEGHPEPPRVWNGMPSLETANAMSSGTLIAHLGIELVELGADYLVARMPVDGRTRQPGGVLHGGASVVLAETLASWAATFTVDPDRGSCLGMEINANHVRPVTSGWVTGVARPLALGRRNQVWEIKITDDGGKLVCVSRCTMAVVSRPTPDGAPGRRA